MSTNQMETETNLKFEIPNSSYYSNDILNMKLTYEEPKNMKLSYMQSALDEDPSLNSKSLNEDESQMQQNEKADEKKGGKLRREDGKGELWDLGEKKDNISNIVKWREERRTTLFDRFGGEGLTENEMILPIVRKFLMRLKNLTIFRLPSQLKNFHYELIEDSSYFYEKEVKSKGICGAFSKTLGSLCSPIKEIYILTENYTFNPYGPFRTSFDVFHFFLLLILFFELPLSIVFGDRFSSNNLLLYLALIFFTCDILLNFNTSYFYNGLLEKKRSCIFMHYINSLFISDILVLFLLSMSIRLDFEKKLDLIKFGIFAKISRFRWLYGKLSAQFKLQQNFKGYLDILTLLFTSILISHLIACLWVYIAFLEIESSAENTNWISARNLSASAWYIQYLHSYYWSIVTMMTVGYGDIIPQNSSEILFAAITIVFGCGVYAYNLNAVGILLTELKREENKYNTNLRNINKFMDKKRIDTELQTRIREYLRFIWSENSNHSASQEQHIIDSLNSSLKEELLLKAYGTILKRFPMFYANFTEKSLRKMIVLMKEMKFTPGDIIFNEQDLDDCAIYFINQGSVSLQLNRSDRDEGILLEKKKEGDCFGEVEFFSGSRRGKTVKSLEFISLFCIKRQDFLMIVAENADDYQKYCMIRDQILIYKNFSALRLRCNSCGSQEHDIKLCPLLHYVADYEKAIKTFDFYKEQERNFFPRRIKQKKLVNCRIFLKRTLMAAEKIQRKLKVEKENLRMARLKRKQNEFFIQYDTMYIGSDVSISSSSGSEDLGESQFHESQVSEKESFLEKLPMDDFRKDEKYKNVNYFKATSLQCHLVDSEPSPQIEENRRYSIQFPDLASSASSQPFSMPPTTLHPPIQPPSFSPPISLFPPSSSNHPFPSSSSQNIIIKKCNLPTVSSCTSIRAKRKKEEWRKDEGNEGKRDEGNGGRREEESGVFKKKGKINDFERCHSIVSKGGSKIGTGVFEGKENIIEMDRASSFKNYFPESNVTSVLEVYEKKRKILAFLHEAKLQTMLENNTTNKIDYVMAPLLTNNGVSIGDEYHTIESNDHIRRRISKYTFYVSKMFDIFSQKKKKNREEATLKKESNVDKYRFARSMKRKTNFFENEGERIKLSDFVLEIMKHPQYEAWKKTNIKKRRSLTIFKKKVKGVKGFLSCFKFFK